MNTYGVIIIYIIITNCNVYDNNVHIHYDHSRNSSIYQ